MESVNKSFDVNEVFANVEKSFEKYKSVDLDDIFEEAKVCSALSIEIVSGLTDILRSVPKMPNSEIVDRVCEFVDMVNDKEGEIWSLSRKGKGKDGEVLISFLKELATKGCISQIDKIFRYGGYRCPLVNELSSYYETKKNLMSCSACFRRTIEINYRVRLSAIKMEIKITHTH